MGRGLTHYKKMQAELVLFTGYYTQLKMLPIYPYPESVYVEEGSTYYLCHTCLVTKAEGSSEFPQPNSFALLDNIQPQFYTEWQLPPAFPNSRAPEAESFSFFGAHNMLPYGCEGTGCILLCSTVYSAISFPAIIQVESYLRAEIMC